MKESKIKEGSISSNTPMDIIFALDGGMGKQIFATAVIRQIHQAYPNAKIHVMTTFPAVFQGIPYVEKFYPMPGFGQGVVMADFFDVHKNFEIFTFNPYLDLKFRQGKEHVVDAWCRRLGVPAPPDKAGKIVLSKQEKQWASETIQGMNLGTIPLVAFQPFGGVSNHNPQEAKNPNRVRTAKNLPVTVAQEVVNLLAKEGVQTIQLSLQTEPQLEKCYHTGGKNDPPMDSRQLFAFLDQCHGLITVDSFAQHAWVALGKSDAVALWGFSSPTQFGYSRNTNLFLKACQTPHCFRPDSFMYDVDGQGKHWQCPYDEACMNFNPVEIVSAIKASISKYQPKVPVIEPPKAQVAEMKEETPKLPIV